MAGKRKVVDVTKHPERFAEVMAEIVSEMCGEACTEAAGILQEVSEDALADVKATAPVSRSAKGTGGHHLRDAFRLDSIVYASRGMAGRYNFGVPAKFVIHAPKWHKYSIVHLVEKGHTTAGFNISKPFVPAHPFMVPAEDRAKRKIIDRLRESGLSEH